MPAIEIDKLSKVYGRGRRAVRALDGVSLQVERGEIYGLLGRNGAGKTTLVKLAMTICAPTRGSIRLMGLSARQPASRRKVGYLPEDHRFAAYNTARQALKLYGALYGMPRAERGKRVEELLELVELRGDAGRKLREYSKGMKQRLGLAQAMLHRPELLFLDEPTDGVDPVGRKKIREVLVRLKEQGVTIFLNSHLLSEVELTTDRVGILEAGKLLKEGDVGSLTRLARVYEVYSTKSVSETAAAVSGLVELCVEREDHTEIALRQETELDRVVDRLREKGIGLRGLVPRRRTLEEVFLATIKESGKA